MKYSRMLLLGMTLALVGSTMPAAAANPLLILFCLRHPHLCHLPPVPPPPAPVPTPTPTAQPTPAQPRSFTSSFGFLYTAGVVGGSAAALIGTGAYVGATEHRELTHREAQGIALGFAIPVVGYFLSEAMWNAHPEWKKYESPKSRRH